MSRNSRAPPIPNLGSISSGAVFNPNATASPSAARRQQIARRNQLRASNLGNTSTPPPVPTLFDANGNPISFATQGGILNGRGQREQGTSVGMFLDGRRMGEPVDIARDMNGNPVSSSFRNDWKKIFPER